MAKRNDMMRCRWLVLFIVGAALLAIITEVRAERLAIDDSTSIRLPSRLADRENRGACSTSSTPVHLKLPNYCPAPAREPTISSRQMHLAGPPPEPADQARETCSVATLERDSVTALKVCNRALDGSHRDDFDRVALLKIRARALNRLDRRHEAIADYELALSIAPRDPELHVWRGWAAISRPLIELEQRDLELAARHASTALAIDPNNAEAYDLMAGIHASQSDFEMALPLYDKAIALEPNAPDPHYHRFRALWNAGRTTEALAEAEDILSLPDVHKPGAVSYYSRVYTSYWTAVELLRGGLLSQLARLPEAQRAYDDAVAQDPSPLTFASRASFGLDPRAPRPDVDADLGRAFALDPNFWLAHRVQDSRYFTQHRYDDALASYKRASELFPENGTLYWMQASALRYLGRTEEAIAAATTGVEVERAFLYEISNTLYRHGYLAQRRATQPTPAVKDAVRACMLDPGCG
jgi:tetratricopeptide (TPR) repeat protein